MKAARAYRLALAECQEKFPGRAADELDDEIDSILSRWAHERAQDIEDTPCLEEGRDNCNDWGTGEGRFHGRL